MPWYLGEKLLSVVCSLIIFSTIMSEFHYVLTSVWRSQIIGFFAFCFVNLNILFCVISVVSVLHTYYCV